MVLVFGATGTIGGAVVRSLTARGVPVTAAVRSPAKGEALRAGGVETVVADLADPGSLADVVVGADRVFLASPGAERQPELEGNLIDALAAAGGPAHLVKLAAQGYDAVPAEHAIKFAANHARIVDHLRTSGLPYTVLAPGGFTSNLLGSAAGVRDAGALYGSAGDGGLGWVDPDDVGAVAAHVLTTDGHEGASYDLTGPEVLTHAQVAGLLGEALGREVRYVDVPAEGFLANLTGAGLPPWTAEAITELNQLYRAHHAETVTGVVEELTGRAPGSVADWIGRHREAFA